MRAKRICGECPVQRECETEALALSSNVPGVWGGLTQRERRKLKRKQRNIAG